MTLPLFAPPGGVALEQDLRDLFEAWVAHRARSSSTRRSERALRAESADVYREMWQAFAAYCARRGVGLAALEADDLLGFLAARGASGLPRTALPGAPGRTASGRTLPARVKGADLTERYAWRLLWLVDRLARFAADVCGAEPNLAAHALLQTPAFRFANAGKNDALPEYLQEADARRLVAFVTEPRSPEPPQVPFAWKQLRDRTAVALMLGAGLTPGDVRALTLDGVVVAGGRRPGVPWKLALPANGNSPARETPLAAWAGRLLALWLAVRAQQGIAGEHVFAATTAGRAWSHARCYEACRAVLEAAGFGRDAAGGLYKLRHTFALRQLARGRTDAEVARWLGLQDATAIARYRRIVPWQVDVA